MSQDIEADYEPPQASGPMLDEQEVPALAAESEPDEWGIDLTAEARPAHVSIAKRGGVKRRNKKIAVLVWLLLLFGLGGGGWWVISGYLNSRINLNASSGGGSNDGVVGLDDQYQRPDIPTDGVVAGLSSSQMLWCLREQLRIEVLAGQFATRREKISLQNLRRRYALICDYSDVDADEIEMAQALIAQRSSELSAQAVNEQLLIILDVEQTWSQSDLVRAVQQLLDSAGYPPGPADGLYGAKTMQAIMSFQQDNGLPVVGEATVTALQQLRQFLRNRQAIAS